MTATYSIEDIVGACKGLTELLSDGVCQSCRFEYPHPCRQCQFGIAVGEIEDGYYHLLDAVQKERELRKK